MKCWLALAVLLTTPAVSADQKLDSLLVYGEGFVFSVKEPEGWIADTETADEYQANAVLHAISGPDAPIRIRVNDKTDEHLERDLSADMESYKKQNPKVRFKDLDIQHPKYRVYPKLFYIPKQFYEYVVYLNPGPQSHLCFSVAMNSHTQATPAQLSAFRSAVASLELIK